MSAPGVSVDLENVEAVMSWERPNVNLGDKKFLGIGWILQEIREWLKLSIQGRIVGFRLRDMDSMVGMTLTIEREIEDTLSTRDAGVRSKREDQSSSSSGKRQKTSASHEFQDLGQHSPS